MPPWTFNIRMPLRMLASKKAIERYEASQGRFAVGVDVL